MNVTTTSRRISWNRRRRSGQELLEFGLLLTVLVPLLLGTFVTGLSLVRSVQTNQMGRDLTDMYIHGADFSTYPMQQVAQSWLVYRLTGSSVMLGLVGFAGQIPYLVLSPIAGVVADRTVQPRGFRSQLEHVAENRHTAARGRLRQVVDRRAH